MKQTRKMNLRRWAPWIGSVLLIALVFATGVFGKVKIWAEMPYDEMTFPDRMDRYETKRYETANGDAYGVHNYGPYFDLPAGTYRLRWYIEGDGANTIRIVTSNQAEIVPNEIKTTPGQNIGEAAFEIKQAAVGLQILVEFTEGTWMNIGDVRLYTPEYRDNAFTLAFLLAGLCLLWELHWRGWLTPQRRGRLVLIGLAVLLASAPFLQEGVLQGHDAAFHMARLENLADGLKSGSFPVRVGGYTFNGYGAVNSAFYPDLFLYPSALMLIAGASIQYVMNVYLIAINILSALTMYACAKRIFGSSDTASAAAILYTLSAYRLMDACTRCAIGEVTALAFLPLFLLGLWEVVLGDKDRWPLLVLGATCVFQSHMLSTVLAALTAIAFSAIYIKRIITERRLGAIVKAVLVTVLVNLFFLVPMITYSLQGIGAESIWYDASKNVIQPAELWMMGMDTKESPWVQEQFSLEIGYSLVIGGMLAVYSALTQPRRDGRERFALLCTAAGIACAMMATNLFPWSVLNLLTNDMTGYLQFPWRMLSLTAVLLALGGAYGYLRMPGANGQFAVLLALIVAMCTSMPLLSDEAVKMEVLQYGEGATPNIVQSEYKLEGSDMRAIASEKRVVTEGGVTYAEYEKQGTNVALHVTAHEAGALEVPLYAFDGYAAELDGQPLAISRGGNNRIRLDIPAGADGDVRIWFEGKWFWRVSDTVSLLSALAFAAYCVKRRKSGKMICEKNSTAN